MITDWSVLLNSMFDAVMLFWILLSAWFLFWLNGIK